MLTQALVRALVPALALSLSACVGTEPPSSFSSSAVSSSAEAVSSFSSDRSSVASNVAPLVSFEAPLQGYTFDQGRGQVAVLAGASDADGNLESVALYINNVLVSSLTEAPFRWPAAVLNSLDAGDHALRLVAIDTLGALSGVNNTITVKAAANNNPTLSFTFPVEGDVLPFRSSLNVTVVADDSDGQVESVLLLLNNQRVAQLTTAPYVWPSSALPQLQNMANGNYVLRALATDNRGGTAVQEISFEVLEENDFPVASFVAPANNLHLPVGSSLDVLADASDTDGDVESVRLTVNGDLVGTDSNPPFEWRAAGNPVLRDLQAGEHSLELIALDYKGGQAKVVNVVRISNSASPASGDPNWGAVEYQKLCITCHGSFGESGDGGPSLIPAKESYSHNGQSYSLYKLIDELMPKNYVTGCVDQCARNVATYVKGPLSDKHSDFSALVGDAATGKVEYQLHCATCHGDRGVGGTEDEPLFPLKGDSGDYMLMTYYVYSRVDLFAMIDLGMPLGPNGYPDGYAEQCSGQCTADVITYLKALEQELTDSEKKVVQLAAGKDQYINFCSGCHGSNGSQSKLIPLSSQQRNNTGLDNGDALYIYNRDRMPPRTPDACDGQCAKDVTVYIREVLDR